MDSRRRFRPRSLVRYDPLRDTGTKEERLCGWPSNRVDAPLTERRDGTARVRGQPRARVFWSRQSRKAECGSTRSVRTVNRHRWARRVASGERVKRGQGTRHTDPVTSEEGMPGSVREHRKVPLQQNRVAVNRPKRLFSKNTGVCQAAQGAVYTLTPARCRKVKGSGYQPSG
jgi:hypothetical protein